MAGAASTALLGAAVALGAASLGAPPRFSAGESGPEWLRAFLTTLAPLSFLEAAIAVALGLLVAFHCLRRGRFGLPGGRPAALVRLPLLLLFALGALALVPLPRGALGIVAPFSDRTYAALSASGDVTLRPMSLWPAGTAHALFNLAGVIAAGAATFALVRGGTARRGAVLVLVFVAALASVESVVGFAATRFGDDRLLGVFEKVSGRGRVTGTFIHGTMMAVWAGMGACAALGLAAGAAAKRRALVAPAIVAAALCAAAGLFTLSRLGWLGVAAGVTTTVVLLGVSLMRGGRRGLGLAFAASALLVVAAAVVLGFVLPAFRERVGYLVQGNAAEEPRFAIWRSAWELFERAPVLGTGLGSFGRAIHLTQSIDCPQELWFAHSDPLNLLSDAGVVGALLALWWLVASLRAALPALGSADGVVRGLAAGALGGAVVVFVASLGDFQTQFPVVAIPFAALLALPAALSAAEASAVAEPPHTGLVPAKQLAVITLLVAAGVALLPVSAAGTRWRELRDAGVTGATRAESLLARGKALLAKVNVSDDAKRDLAAAEATLREAARLDPLLDEAHLWTGITAQALGESRDDVFRALGRARLVSRGHAQTNLVAGRTYLDLLGTSPAPYGPPGDTAVKALREAGEIDPHAYSAAWKACTDRGMPLEVLRAITPDRSYAKSALFDHLKALGRDDEAMALLQDQIERDPHDEGVVRRLAAAYRECGRSSEGRAFFDRVGAVWPTSN